MSSSSGSSAMALAKDSRSSPGTGMNGEKQKNRLENILFKLKRADPEDGSPCAVSGPPSPDPGSEGSGDLGPSRDGLAGSEGQRAGSEGISSSSSSINRRSSRKPIRRERGSQSMEHLVDDNMNDTVDSNDLQAEGGSDPKDDVSPQEDQADPGGDKAAVRVKTEREDGGEWPGVFNKMSYPSDLYPDQQDDDFPTPFTYSCEKCGDVFPTLHELDTHIDTHIKQETKDFSVYPCNVCGKSFTSERYLSQHMTTHPVEDIEEPEPVIEENVYLPDSSGPSHKCDHCRRLFYTDDEFQQHKCQKGRLRPFGCGRCGRSYSQVSVLKTHLLLHERGLTTDLECYQCGQKFMYSIELRRHMNIHIKADLTAALFHQSSTRSAAAAAAATSTSLSSTANGDATANADSLPSLKLKIPLSRLVAKKKPKAKSSGGVKAYPCQVCQKIFHRRSSLCMHMRIHSDKKFECSYCSKLFTFKKSLEIHVRSHTGEKPYQCSFCTKCFTRQDTLHKHEKIHLGVKPYVCETCGRQYCDKFDLQRHSHSHTQDKPYKCTMCSKAYTERKRLKEHMFFHSGDLPFVCDLCGKGFARKYRYDHHLSQHTGEVRFQCELCSKGFYRRSDLNSHMETHSSKKPYTCDICGLGFLRESYLRRHMIVHCTEKPHECNMCGKSFARKGTLRRHLMIHKRNDNSMVGDSFRPLHGQYSHYTADFGCGISGSVAPMTGSNPEERDIMKDIQAVIGLGDDVSVFE